MRDIKQALIFLVVAIIHQITHRQGKDCPNCKTLGEILKWTEKELQKTKRELEEAKRKLKEIEKTANYAAAKAAGEMSGGSGVPRGQWSYSKGALAVANDVLKILGVKPHKPKGEQARKAKRIFKKLFM